MPRPDGRRPDELRLGGDPASCQQMGRGSVLIKTGDTHVFVRLVLKKSAAVFERIGQGWVTAEYGMLPRATKSRNIREAAKGSGWTAAHWKSSA